MTALWRGLPVRIRTRDTIIHGKTYSEAGFAVVIPISLALMSTASLQVTVTRGSVFVYFSDLLPSFQLFICR